jgi:hypothetical protein
LTSYTTGFYLDCDDGEDPVLSHQSCVMTTSNDTDAELCAIDPFFYSFHNFSGASPGSANVIEGVGVNLHQVCFSIPENGSISIVEDDLTDLTAAITLEDETPHDDYPSYATFEFDSITYCGILPVRYGSFTVSKGGDYIAVLDWTTTEETNNAYFDIERSNDGGKTFVAIGRMDAVIQPRTVNPYQFIDHTAKPGTNYYRLRQVDRDNRFSYSPIRHVKFTADNFAVTTWPNPVEEQLFVYITHADAAGTIRMLDMAGQVALEQSFENGDSAHELYIERLPEGVYSLLIQSGPTAHIEKIVVLR